MKFQPALVATLTLIAAAAPAEETLVLVAWRDSPISDLETLDVRKAYLGISVAVDRRNVRPVRLTGDDHMSQVFLQSVIAMSQRSYERRLLSLTLKFGRPRPLEVDSVAEVLRALQEQPFAIAYLWERDVTDNPEFKILRVLWRGP